ncbi:MAG: leucine--tRNA ligase, partial [Nitrosopumilus sp.]
GTELIGKSVIVPHRNESIVMLPASFVESGTGTGMVMSVPAHAPFDYQALIDIKKSPLDYDLASKVDKIIPISIIETDGYGENPAKETVEKFEIADQNDPKLEEATKEVYGKEFYGGKLKPNTEKFTGIKVAYAKDMVKNWLIENKHADILLELTNTPIKCRCGAECVVKVLNNQWFLNYGDKDWKDLGIKCFDSMNILPQEIKSEFDYVIGWLRERACARQHGLGTKLPWDNDWIVESLSDSVIYMAYYTISKFVNNKKIIVADCNLSKEFFDYIFLDIGERNKVSEITKINLDTIDEIKKEFQYFYPVDSRHSGRDLVPNHLTFFVLNHVAIFPEKNWPGEIVVNGSVLMNGSKMSKSMGNIIPLRKAIQDYGADPIRLAIIISAELLQDADFNMESISVIQNKLESFYQECSRLKSEKIGELQAEDKWILSKTQSMGLQVTAAIEKMRLREALHDILFAFESNLSWYLKRIKAKNRNNVSGILHQINSIRVAMLSPFAPHIAEEMWEILGHHGLVSTSKWPEFSQEKIDPTAIQSEDLLKSTMDDIANILRVTKIRPQKITIYTADSFKSKVYHSILEKVMTGQTNMGVVMKELIANPDTSKVKKIPNFVQKTIKDILSEPTEIRQTKLESKEFNEKRFLVNELAGIVKRDFSVDIQVFAESDSNIYDPKGKARHARPFKPAILIE